MTFFMNFFHMTLCVDFFIGFVEKTDNTYFFATNLHAANHADGNAASKISMSILSNMNIWE